MAVISYLNKDCEELYLNKRGLYFNNDIQQSGAIPVQGNVSFLVIIFDKSIAHLKENAK